MAQLNQRAAERRTPVSLTSKMKEELARISPENPVEAAAELSTLLRFAGGLHIVGGRIVVEGEVDSPTVAYRLSTFLKHLFGTESQVIVVGGGALKKGNRYVVRVVRGAEEVARQAGLLDGAGRPVRGLPPQVVGGGLRETAAAWRGAFLARGSLMEPGRSASMELTCPGSESALAMVGCARRLGATAKAKEVRGSDRVSVRDAEAIGALIQAMGAEKTFELWRERREKREARGAANRLANFDDANLRRSARAAVAAGARVQRAFEILGDDVPEHLKEAGHLRLTYRQASLEELGQKSEPKLTKDAVAGRIRRLLALADKVAAELDIPDTEAVLTIDMIDGD